MRNAPAFLSGCALAGILWFLAWPNINLPTEVDQGKESAIVFETTLERTTPKDLIRRLKEANSDEERYHASASLSRVPSAGLEQALEEETLIENNHLTFVAKVLMIRWAEGDGEAATNWAWKRFRSNGLWNEAFREMGPAWASHSPASFGAWVKNAGQRKIGIADISKAMAEESETPLLDFDGLTRCSRWLMSEDPRLAYQILLERGGWSTGDTHFADPLKTVEQVNQALSAFENLDQMKPGTIQGNEIYVFEILERWKVLDRESFDRSPLARLTTGVSVPHADDDIGKWASHSPERRARLANEASAEPDLALRQIRMFAIARKWAELDPEANSRWMETLPPIQREACTAAAFDAWTQAHPGERADHTGWPAARVRAWEDLEILQVAECP